ncbi:MULTISPECIES: MFS transporter [unclassified Curtobacterium]|uniref:MFS transporter n=1 Tax=unclassified Curtobacterium TaxID=257496 RepID=UPI00052ADAE1|nr:MULTISPECIES: MFS transporter [unclassified Curtobacterium]AIV41183.1 MFS transporter [Curtobacterium sp. MR_MD2014]MBP1301910.1 putative MFS family arabinose efflux permease [Curtobacterium sp. 1310]MCM3523199.1 MFS transporter [Curtobacterium sp. P97]
MTRGRTLLFAVAGGAAVGNLYWAQPLLDDIAADLGTSPASAGFLVTLTQVGYALGILLLVPLGDVVDRRRLVPGVLAASAVALLAAALAPGFSALLVALALVGATTVAGQLLIPLAGDLADPASRGRVVGTIASGVLTGILLSRTVSGVIAEVAGWRSVYVLAAVVAVVLAFLLARAVPRLPRRERVRYPQLIASVVGVVRAHLAVRVTLVVSASVFAVFTMFWTALTFLLSSAPFGYSTTAIGAVGLVGLAGAVAAQRVGRLHDRGWSVPVTGAALVLVLVSLVVAGLGARSIVVVLVAVLLLDVGVQATNVLNQTRLFAIDPAARSRLNTAFVTGNFAGGAVGSAIAGVLWNAGGWTAVTVGAAVLVGFATTVWAVHRRGALALPGRTASS